MIIRSEKPSDIDAITNVNVEAFKNHPFSHQSEHLIVKALRDSGGLVLSLVAEDESKVIGHIAFSEIKIDGKDCEWYGIGPLAVLPDYQKKGIGSELLRAGLAQMQEMGARGCALVGNPVFYTRFGFTSKHGLILDEVPPENFLVFPFEDEIPKGITTFHQAFLI